MQSDRESEEIKNCEDKNIKKLREEFEKKKAHNENHPKTSHGSKNSFSHNSYSSNSKSCKKSPKRYNKALSANKYNQKIYKNANKLNDKISYDFCKKHPGYLYYKEIFASMKNNKLNKIRTLTGKVINRKMKLEPAPKNIKKSNNNKFNKNQKFPKINSGYGYNYKFNGKQTYYNKNQIDKNNPYSFFWANKILNQTDFKIGVKGMAYGVPQLGSINKKEEFFLKAFNKADNSNKNSFKNKNVSNGNKFYYNNFVGIPNQKNIKKEKITKGVFDENKNDAKNNNDKCFKIKNSDNNENDVVNVNDNDIENNSENNKAKILEDKNNNDNNDKKEDNNNKKEEHENEFEEESFDEEQQKQFYQNQKNFFKARKDIMEEPEYLEEDNDINE